MKTNETQKIAVACFVGGVVCCAVALMFTPEFLWLGLFAGFAGGYISYEFHEILKAIPIALEATKKGSTNLIKGVVKGIVKEIKEVLADPIACQAVIISIIFFCCFLLPIYMIEISRAVEKYRLLTKLIFDISILTFIFHIIFFIIIFASAIPLYFLALIGARVKNNCYWNASTLPANYKEQKENLAEFKKRGLHKEKYTYTNTLHWQLGSLAVIAKFLTWTMWKYTALIIWFSLCFWYEFAWFLIIAIHSEKRLLCAVDGTLGGAISYIWLASVSTSFMEQLLFIIFGGLLGAAFGVLNWEIVSKRILKVVPNHH